MNNLERRMVDILKELKEKHGVISVRAEFEAEGTKMEELLRLKEICMSADLGLTLKIGGCESIRDMIEARTVGVNYLVAPMVESSYSLRKYLQAISKVFSEQERRNIEVLCNIETGIAGRNMDEMLQIPEILLLKGIVIERVDYCFSVGKDDTNINDEDVNKDIMKIIEKAKNKGLLCTIGGGVSAQSLPFFLRIPEGHLDRYETRKICFSADKGLRNNPEKGILKALGFEVLWLRNKMDFYKSIQTKDLDRMTLLEHRYLKAIDTLI